MPSHPHHLRWYWSDEIEVLRNLRPQSIPRYVTATLRRARDFEGQPVTPEWEATFLALVHRVRQTNANDVALALAHACVFAAANANAANAIAVVTAIANVNAFANGHT